MGWRCSVTENSEQSQPMNPTLLRRRRRRIIAGLVVVLLFTAILSALVSAMLVNIWTRKEEAKSTFVRLVNVDENTTDPMSWGTNFPREYDQYLRTSDITKTNY